MAEEIIRQGEEALRNGDLRKAVFAKKALACTIRLSSAAAGERAYLVQKHDELYAGIGDLINKAGSLR